MSGDPGLFFWISLFLRRWRFLVAVPLGAGLLALAIAFLLPRWYEGRARILPPREIPPPILSPKGIEARIRLETQLPFSQGVTMSDVFLGIMESERVARAIIRRFDLRTLYDEETVARTLKTLRARTRMGPDRNGIIEVRVQDKDPARAADLANAYVEELDRIYRETLSGSARRQREFLESRLAGSETEIDSLQRELVRLQEERGVTTLSGDLAEAAQAAGELLGRRLALTVRLEMLDRMGVVDSPARSEIEAELAALESELARLPVLGLDIARLVRDVRIQEHLHFVLAEQLEVARLEEVRDTPTVDVLDPAIVPDRHIRPRKGLVSLAGVVLGFGLALLWVAYRDRSAEGSSSPGSP